jgi:hypothetical protein
LRLKVDLQGGVVDAVNQEQETIQLRYNLTTKIIKLFLLRQLNFEEVNPSV